MKKKEIKGGRYMIDKIKQFIKTAADTVDDEKRVILSQIKQFIEWAGIYIFLVSLILFRQIKWVKKHNGYSEIEIRLLLGFLIGILLSFVIIKIIKKIAVKYNKEHETFLNRLSIALSPGILFIFASANKVFLTVGVVLCILTALYIWVKPFRDFINDIIYVSKFKGVLTVEDNNAIIIMQGTYEKLNPKAMQSFLIDMVINFHECSEMNIGEVKVDFAGLIGNDENELKPIIESVAKYFNLRIVY